MARYIDAELLIKSIANIGDLRTLSTKTIGEAISKTPTADVVEVKRGEWRVNAQCNHKPSRYKNPEKWVTYKCSKCGYRNGRRKPNYCPNCGAKMDGRSDT